MQRMSKILSCLIGCYLLLFYARETDGGFAAAIYYTSPSPLLNNHRLRFHVPDGWKLVAVKLENPQQGVVSLAISSNGQIQDHPFWDFQGITLLFSSKQHQQQELTLSLGYFKNYHNPEKHSSFQTATGLTGGLDYLEKPTSSHPFSVCLWLSVPILQSKPLILDRTYGTFLFLQASIKPASLNESLHLLKSFAATISIDSKPYPPANWLPGIALPLQTRSVYHCLPSLWLDGREVHVRLPKGWRLVRFAGETAGGGAWETLVPNMILVPEGRSSKRGYLDFSVTVDSLRYELGHDSLSGYPIITRSGLSGLFAPTDEGYMATLYAGPHLFWMPDQGSMLDINCVVKGTLKDDVKRVVMSLLAGLEVVPPSVEKRAPLSLYSGHLRYLWSSLKATSFLMGFNQRNPFFWETWSMVGHTIRGRCSPSPPTAPAFVSSTPSLPSNPTAPTKMAPSPSLLLLTMPTKTSTAPPPQEDPPATVPSSPSKPMAPTFTSSMPSPAPMAPCPMPVSSPPKTDGSTE